MFRIYVKILLPSWVLLFSHHDSVALQLFDPPPSYIAIKKGERSTSLTRTQINTLCNGEATTFNPHDYAKCDGTTLIPSKESIKQLPNFHSRVKAHIKRSALTPGHEMHTLIAPQSATVSLKNRQSLARVALRRTLTDALMGEMEAASETGALNAAGLGLTVSEGATIMGIFAAQPEVAVPVLAIGLGGEAIVQSFYQVFKHLTNNSSVKKLPNDFWRDVLNSADKSHLKITQESDSRFSQRETITILIPTRCQFPIVRNKLYLGHFTVEDLTSNDTMKALKQHLGDPLYQKALKNIQPVMDNNQFCMYQRLQDKRAPFKPVRDISTQSMQQNKLYLVVRTIQVTTDFFNNKTYEILPDRLISGDKVFYDPEPLSSDDPRSIFNFTVNTDGDTGRFTYRGLPLVFDNMLATGNIILPNGESVLLTTRASLEFYRSANAYKTEFAPNPETYQKDVTSLLSEKNKLTDYLKSRADMGEDDIDITLHDILDWSTNPGGTFQATLSRVKPSVSFMNIGPDSDEGRGDWFVRDGERSHERLQPDTAQALARIIDFLGISTSSPGVMGQIEFIIVVTARSADWLWHYNKTRGYGKWSFLSAFDALLSYQRSKKSRLVEFKIEGKEGENTVSKPFPNNNRTQSLIIPFDNFQSTKMILPTSESKHVYLSETMLSLTNEWPKSPTGEYEVPVAFRYLELNRDDEYDIDALQTTLEFDVNVYLFRYVGNMLPLFTMKGNCNDSAQCNSWRLAPDIEDRRAERYSNNIFPGNRVLVCVTTNKNINGIDVGPIHKKILKSVELSYLASRATVISM